jgi:hypothetical protein
MAPCKNKCDIIGSIQIQPNTYRERHETWSHETWYEEMGKWVLILRSYY